MGTIASELSTLNTNLTSAVTLLATLVTDLKAQIGPQNGDSLSPTSQASLDSAALTASNLLATLQADVAAATPPAPTTTTKPSGS